jgi:tRNA nucleotidyltransferase (CCA-adding enzyme)
LADRVARHHGLAHRAAELRPTTILELLTAVDGLRRSSQAFDGFLIACEADARGRTGLENRPYEQAEILQRAQQAALAVDAATLATSALEGPALGAAIRDARIAAIARAIAQHQPP